MRFRRKAQQDENDAGTDAGPNEGTDGGPDVGTGAGTEATSEEPAEASTGSAGSESGRDQGPWDIDETDWDPEEDGSKLDLGSLVVTPRAGLDLQLQVDEQSGQVVAVVLAGPEGAVELRAFAAPRNGDIWEDVRRQIAAEVTRRGGTATEHAGPYGPELRVVLTYRDGRDAGGERVAALARFPRSYPQGTFYVNGFEAGGTLLLRLAAAGTRAEAIQEAANNLASRQPILRGTLIAPGALVAVCAVLAGTITALFVRR